MAVIISDVPIEAGGIQNRYSDVSGILGRAGLTTAYRAIQSDNFVTGSAGWQLTAEGDLEASSGTFRGALAAISGTIGGFTIGANTLTGIGDTTIFQTHADSERGIKINCGNYATNIATGFIEFWTDTGDEALLYYNNNDAGLYIEGAMSLVTNCGIIADGNILPAEDDANDLGSSSKQWKDLYLSGNIIGNDQILTADEAISAGDAVFVSDGTQLILKLSCVGDGTKNFYFGETTDGGYKKLKRAQRFIAPNTETITRIRVFLEKINAPEDSVRVGIQGDDGTENHYPDGTYISYADLAASSITGDWVEYAFTVSAALTQGTIYHIVIQRTGAGDNTNNYNVRGSSDDPYADGKAELFWTLNDPPTYTQIWVTENNQWDLQFKLYGAASTAGRIMKTTAAYTGYYETFIGFARTAITSGLEGQIMVNGVNSLLSGLTAGKQYYLSDTLGAISTSAGTNTRKVGISISTTGLLMNNIW